MRILLTNDDGIYAKGLYAVWEELSRDYECVVVAPEREQSAVGHAITLTRPLMVKKVRRNGMFFGYAVAGTPADCVKIGIKELSEKPVDLVISGINLGPNVGTDIIYSGTVSAATEAAILGVSSIAISLATRDASADFSHAAGFAGTLARFVMARKIISPGIPLNVNVPAIPREEIRGVVVVAQAKSQMVETFERRVDPRHNTYYWLMGETEKVDGADDACVDTAQLGQGMITITPIHYDLTRYDMMGDLAAAIKHMSV